MTSVFEALIEELSTQTRCVWLCAFSRRAQNADLLDVYRILHSRPVLLAIDDCQSLFATTSYVDPSYNAIGSFSLVVPRMLMEFASGQRQFVSVFPLALPNTRAATVSSLANDSQASGSVLLSPCSLSPSQSPALADFLSASSSSPSKSSPYDHPSTSSYTTYSSLLSESGLEKFSVPSRLTTKEASGVVEMLKAIRGIRVAEGKGLGDKEFLERLVGSDANPREFVKQLRKSAVA